MSNINTNPINVNYPVPGVNNNSQGFRDNFASIVTNLNTAGNEITDLQNNVVVKNALQNTTVNNDMANTLISNASTRGFRATSYNLGNALSGTVLVNVTLGDVQYGTVAANTTFNFGSWAPTGTQSNVTLQLAVSNANAVISFSGNVVTGNNYGASTLENYSMTGNLVTVTAPNGVSQLNYLISTLDCGNSLSISPVNRPRQATQIQGRLISPVGFNGDVPGDVAVGPSLSQLTITSSNSNNCFSTTDTTSQLYTDLPVVFTGVSFEANVLSGATYYVKNVVSSNSFTISSTIGGSNVVLAGSSGLMYANPVNYLYIATDTYEPNSSVVYSRNVLSTASATNNITLDTPDTTSLVVNSPIIFTANIGGLYANTVYYIKSISSPNITVSQSRTNGVAGTVVTLTTATGNAATTANVFVGDDIWQQIPLTPSISGNSFGNVSINGILSLPTVGNLYIPGGTNGYVLQTDGAGNLSWTAKTGGGSGGPVGTNTEIQYNNYGNFGATIGFTFNSSTSQLSVPGPIVATGNITGSNFIGSLSNGTSNVSISTLNGNVTLVSSGNTTLTVTNTGANITGYANITGNLSAPNLIGALANGNSNINIPNANGNVNISAAGNANILVITSTGANLIGTANVSGNANVGNLGTAGVIIATGNITGGNLITLGNANIGNGNIGGNLFVNSNAAIGNISAGGIITALGSIGYTTGAGGAVTQITSRTTSVTINKITGSITLVSAAGSPSYTSFTVTNSTVSANDVIIINQKSGTDKYAVYITNISSGSFQITFADITGTTVEQPVFSFAVIKGAVA